MSLSIPILIQDQEDPCCWLLKESFFYWEGEELEEIPAGFVFDFASIPRLFWNIVSPTELGDTAPLKHDWKYRNIGGNRAEVDRTFLRDMASDNIKPWKRNAAYFFVRLFGWRSWNSGTVIIKELPKC